MSKLTTVVISDLHVSAGQLDDCDAELESGLVGFLGDLSSRAEPVELVINGDFIDFVQAPPYQGAELESKTDDGIPLCFTQSQSLEKLNATLKAHARIFKSLGEFLGAKPENRLVILPGNHDADFFWDDVRALFTEEVCRQNPKTAERLIFHLEQAYRPEQCDKVWIEHGHQYDPINRFYVDDRPCWSNSARPIFKGRDGQERLYECMGTRFMIRFMNRLDATYPFVDNVKPFSRFLYSFGLSALKGWSGPLKAGVSVWAMLRYLGSTLVRSPSELLSLEPGEELALPALLSDALGRMSASARKNFMASLQEREKAYGVDLGLDRPLNMYLQDDESANKLLDFLAANPDLLDSLPQENNAYLSIGGGDGTLSMGKGFYVDETRELIRAAARVQQEHGTEVILMGHTHERVDNPPDARYFNTGCWTRYYRHGRDKKMGVWEVLKEGSYKEFPYELNYAEIPSGQPQLARIITYLPKDEK